MSNEIRMTAGFSLQNGNLSDSQSVSNFPADQATAGEVRNVQTIPFASAAALNLGSVATPGVAWFRNLDATHFVQIGTNGGGFVSFAKLLPGEVAIVRLATAAPYAQADTAAVKLSYVILET